MSSMVFQEDFLSLLSLLWPHRERSDIGVRIKDVERRLEHVSSVTSQEVWNVHDSREVACVHCPGDAVGLVWCVAVPRERLLKQSCGTARRGRRCFRPD